MPAVLRAADYVVLVTEPKPLAYPPLQRSIDPIVRPSGVPFRVLINNVDMAKGGARKQFDARDACEAMDVPVFKTFIRSYSVHEEASLNGQLATTYPRTLETSTPSKTSAGSPRSSSPNGPTPSTSQTRPPRAMS